MKQVWWARTGRKRHIQQFLPGHSMAFPLTVKYRAGKIQAPGLLQGTWLDCGCADGGYTVALVDAGASRAVGVDVQEERIVQACERVHPAVEFHHVSAETLPSMMRPSMVSC